MVRNVRERAQQIVNGSTSLTTGCEWSDFAHHTLRSAKWWKAAKKLHLLSRREYPVSGIRHQISSFRNHCLTQIVRQAVFVLLIVLTSPAFSAAQGVIVTSRVDSNNILIGDWLNLHVEVRHPATTDVQFVALPESLAGFEILKHDSLRRSSDDQSVLESTEFTITSFDSGTFIIPPIKVRYRVAGDTVTKEAESLPIPIFVHSVGVDTSQAIKDIKPPMSLGISFAEVLPYLIGVAVIGALVWLVMYIMKKRKRGEPLIAEAPPRPADEVALEALRSLESEKFWQRGKVKEYHSKVTDIVRLYLEGRFRIMALEMITDEILDTPAIKNLEKETFSSLRDMLTLADLVKFAKFQPLPEENERSMRSAYAFVEGTRRIHQQHTTESVKEGAGTWQE